MAPEGGSRERERWKEPGTDWSASGQPSNTEIVEAVEIPAGAHPSVIRAEHGWSKRCGASDVRALNGAHTKVIGGAEADHRALSPDPPVVTVRIWEGGRNTGRDRIDLVDVSSDTQTHT